MQHNGMLGIGVRFQVSGAKIETTYMKLLESKSEPQNVEYRMSKDGIASLALLKMDRSTQKLTTGRIHLFDVH
jgi:hypothetical protein